MEYRKLISFGKNSFVVSLPKNWIRQNKLKKGDLIYVDESKSSLVLSPSQRESNLEKETVILVDGKNFKRIQREIIAAYINNSKTITLKGTEIKHKAKEIQGFIQKLVALEVIEQDSKRIVAKDFLNLKDISVEQIITKMAIITRSMFTDCLQMFKEDNYESIYLRDQDVNKFRFLIYRIVWYGMENPSEILRRYNLNQIDLFNYWWVSLSIEQMGDCIKRVARYMKEIALPPKAKKQFLTLLTSIEKQYVTILKAYNTKNLELAYGIAEDRGNLIDEAGKFMVSHKNVDNIGHLIQNTKGLVVNLNGIARILYQGMPAD